MRRKDKDLRREALKRDNNTCQLCKKKHKPRFLQIHHILMWSRAVTMRFEVENVISLCYWCHKSIRGHEHNYQQLFLGLNYEKKNR